MTSTAPILPKEWHFTLRRKLGIAGLLATSALLFAMMCWACRQISADTRGAWIAVIILTFGIACGWLAGTVSSPNASSEWARFSSFGKAIGTFLSGYVLSKADPLITQALTLSTWRTHEEAAFRVLVWVTGFVMSTMVTYAMRVSLLPPSTEDELKEAVAVAAAHAEIAAINAGSKQVAPLAQALEANQAKTT